ncbi:TonB-dependent receptor plug domain-containing protein [Thalassotalea ganghwensis]
MKAINRYPRQLLNLSLFAALVSSPLQVSAKATTLEQIGAETYKPLFFSQYSPQTALDMVTQLPGFSLIETDDDIRGFASGAGNVLIDGRRPTTKSGGIRDALSRIPASQVAYIEIIRGTSGTSDAAGQAVVANIIQHKKNAAKRWEFGVGQASNVELSPSAELLISTQLGRWESSFKLNVSQENQPRTATIDNYSADGQLKSLQIEDRPSQLNNVFLSSDAVKQFTDGQRLSINARLGWSQFMPETERKMYAGDANENQAPLSLFGNQRDSQYYAGELGIEWQQDLTPEWQWRVLSINNAQNWFVDSSSQTVMPLDTMPNVSSLRFDEHKSEHVVRSLVSHASDNDIGLMRQEYGIEIALNQLDSWLKLWDGDSALSSSASRNSYSNARELRSEMFANFAWQYDKVTLETGLAGEYSKIEVDGDSVSEQSLTYFKPSLAVIYNLNDNTQYRWDIRRSVGQLDFSDFAASADLVDDREFSGNARLKPDSKIRTALAIDHRFSDKGAATLVAYYEWRQDVLEQVILPSGDYSLGNAGDAKVKGLEGAVKVPLFTYIKGAQVNVVAKFIDAEFNDPLTGESRALSNINDPTIKADFRQDLEDYRISWGVGYQANSEYESFYVNEYSYFKNQGRWSVFIEGFLFNDFKINLSITNLGDENQLWNRTLFNGTRNGAIASRQVTKRTRTPYLSLSISQAF